MQDPIESAPPSRLPCPECAEEVPIEAAHAVDGAAAHCPYCGADLILQCERVDHGRHVRWELIEDGDDEP
ncbi:hypothetical protein [Solimonas soli]|uniref:hypothetical protein n=1 Tax=Solimonas soli TaxID=413479 RepID=UPI0004B2EF02|nr:hypothetical protein [Solimonas soli]